MNTGVLLNLEFTQLNASLQGCRKSTRPSTSVKNLLQINFFLTNKANSPIVQKILTYLLTMNYAISTCLMKVKNKPNSNPILDQKSGWQSQFKPKQSQFSSEEII